MKRREFLSCTAAASIAACAGDVAASTTLGKQATSDRHDLVLKNGRILDGAGNPWFTADIALKDGRISKIGRVGAEEAERTIDVDGLFVSPGFIDIHNHSDTSMFSDPWIESLLRQGITTNLNGNCGGSPAPRQETQGTRGGRAGSAGGNDWSTLEEYFSRIEAHGIAQNMITLVGHGTVRNYVMEGNHGTPTQKQLDEMKELVREAMIHGAAGFSTGLAYSPGCYAHTDEVVELTRVAAEYGGIYGRPAFPSQRQFTLLWGPGIG